MARFRLWPRSRKSNVVPIGLDPAMSQFLRMGRTDEATTPNGALALYEQSSIVSVPVNWIASAFSSVRAVVEQANGDFSTEDPVLDLLRRPSPEYTAKLLKQHLAVNFLVTGEAALVAAGPIASPPVEIVPLSPKDYDARAGVNNVAERFVVTGLSWNGTYVRDVVDAKLTRYVADEFREFKQIRGFNTSNNGLLRGQSPIQMAAREVRQHVLGGEHNVSVLEKGGRVSLLFHLRADMSQDQFEQQRRRIISAYGGASEAGKIAVTAGEELDIREVGQSSKDMDWINLQEKARMTLALQYRLPLSLAFLDASTLDNYKVGKLALFDDAVLPLADAIFDGLTDFLMPRFGRDPAQERITYDKKQISALESRMLEQLKLRKDIGIETLDELRATGMGLDEYDPEADAPPGAFIYASSALAPLGSDPLADTGLLDSLAAPATEEPREEPVPLPPEEGGEEEEPEEEPEEPEPA